MGPTICRQLGRNVGSLETPFVAVILLIIVSSLGFLLSKNKGSQPIKTLISLLLPLLTSYSSVLVFFFFSLGYFWVQWLHFWCDFGKKY